MTVRLLNFRNSTSLVNTGQDLESSCTRRTPGYVCPKPAFGPNNLRRSTSITTPTHEITYRVATESTHNKIPVRLLFRLLLQGYHEVKQYVVPWHILPIQTAYPSRLVTYNYDTFTLTYFYRSCATLAPNYDHLFSHIRGTDRGWRLTSSALLKCGRAPI